MKILLVINKPSREMLIMESIKRELLSIDQRLNVAIRQRFTPEFNRFVFRFKPEIILTYPFTSETLSLWFYIFKAFLGSKIISFRTEGVVDFSNEYNVEWSAGFDKYGSSLVDYELFWGGKMARAIGEKLCARKKLSSMDRIKVVGYPRLETYFRKNLLDGPELPSRISQKFDRYKKEQIVLFITGFHMANYSKQNLFDARDLDAENNLDELLEGVEISKRFRSEWISSLITAANENPDILLVLKKHPIEQIEDYETLQQIDNIFFLHEDIPINEVVPHAGLFFHYGSTALADAYLSQVPAIYVNSKKNKQWYSDLGWPSTMRVDVGDISETIKKYTAREISFELTDAMKKVLYEMFNIEEGKEYTPSREIAEIILDPMPPQKVKITDRYLWRSVWILFIWIPIFLRIRNIPNKLRSGLSL